MRTKPAFVLSLAWVVAVPLLAQPSPIVDVGLVPGDMGLAPATNSQQDHSVARGGDKYLVAWTDYRARNSGSQSVQSDGDILGMRLNGDGQPIDEAPFRIAGGMGLQQSPRVAWNGENWLVVFVSQDPVGGYFGDQLRAVRVSPGGAVLEETPILFPPTQFDPSTIGLQVAGQSGQWLVTRCLYHSDGYGTYLAGQRINGLGQLQDATPIMLNDWVYGATKTIVNSGEYLVVGPDWNDSATFKARRVNLNAQPIGASFTVPSLDIAGNGSEYYVVWIANFVDLVGSRMTSTGTLLTPAGTMIVPGFGQYSRASLTHDGTMWWLEWGAADRLKTVRISASGLVLDAGGGVTLPISIGGNINVAYSPVLQPRSGGGVLLFWYDSRVALGYDTNVYTLPVEPENVAGLEVCVSTGTRSQRNPDFCAGPGDTSALVFVSEAANDDRVLVHLLDAAGNAVLGEPIEVYQGPTVGKAGIAFNGELFLVAFDVGSSGLTPTQIKARRVAVDGSFVDAAPFDVMGGFNADVEALGDDFLVAGSRFGAYPQNIFLYADRIDGPTGAVLDGPSGLYLGGGYVSGMPRVRADGMQWFVAAHSMWSHDSSQGDAILAKVSSAGVPSQAVNPTPFSGGSGDLDIAFSGSKYLLVWRMNSLSNANNSIAGRIMNADGTFPSGYFTIAEAAGRQLRPTVGWDGETFVVAWDDQRNQDAFYDARTDIYGARVSEGGVVLDPAGFAIDLGEGGNAAAALLSRPNAASLVACARLDYEPPTDSYRVGVTRIGDVVLAGDLDGDGDLDLNDYALFGGCLTGPGELVNADCAGADLTGDLQVDLLDFAVLQELFGG